MTARQHCCMRLPPSWVTCREPAGGGWQLVQAALPPPQPGTTPKLHPFHCQWCMGWLDAGFHTDLLSGRSQHLNMLCDLA